MHVGNRFTSRRIDHIDACAAGVFDVRAANKMTGGGLGWIGHGRLRREFIWQDEDESFASGVALVFF